MTKLAHSTYLNCLNYLSWFCLKWVGEHSDKQLGEPGGSNQCPRDGSKHLEKKREGTNVSNLCSCLQIEFLHAACRLHVNYDNTSFSRWNFLLSHCSWRVWGWKGNSRMVRNVTEMCPCSMSVYSLSIAYCATACERGNFGQGNQRILLSFFSPFLLDPKAVPLMCHSDLTILKRKQMIPIHLESPILERTYWSLPF